MNNQSDAYDAYTDGRARTKWDLAVDLLVAYNRHLLLLAVAVGVAGWLGWLKVPDLLFWHWFLIGSFVAGILLGAPAVLWELSDYLQDRRVRVLLAPVQSGVADVVHIPRKTFGSFDVIGTRFPDRRLLTGGKILVARAIDFSEKIIVPAQEFDDSRYPDDLSIIGEDGDGSQVQKYRQALLEDARERHRITVDEEVIRETAMRDAVDLFSKALRDVRDGDIELQQLDDGELESQAEAIIQQAARTQASQSEGEGDE